MKLFDTYDCRMDAAPAPTPLARQRRRPAAPPALLAALLAVLGVGTACGGAATAQSSAEPGLVSAPAPAPAPIAVPDVRYRGDPAPLTRAADNNLLTIPAGPYITGSDPAEREQAYRDYRTTAGHEGARRGSWFDRELPRREASLPEFRIDRQLVTNAAYAEFVRDTQAALPQIDRETWKQQGFIQDYVTHVVRHQWQSPEPPPDRADHPVVLITWAEAAAYCDWRGQVVGQPRRLPTEAEYEKAARGNDGRAYPWGDGFDPTRLNSQVAGPYDTTPVGSFPSGVSPYGLDDATGNVFQWTATRWRDSPDRMTVKGSAWDDYAGVGRPAQRHGRRAWVRHVLIGFRCAADG